MLNNFVKYCLDREGHIRTLLVPAQDMINPSLMNPSIIKVDNEILVNLRNVNYILYHAEKNLNEHAWGPLCYLHPENEIQLATHNIICTLDKNYNVASHCNIDTSKLDVKPLWEFIGLEDCRLVRWDNKLYVCGVRRDTTPNGQGRMELSEIVKENNIYKEINRARIPAPPNDKSYCEKNWMPILDKPYHFVKWTNETEVVKYDPVNKTCETVLIKKYKDLGTGDLRGGSQVIKFGNYYLALVHETLLYKSEAGRKDATYYHRFVVWNEDFDIIKVSPLFNFMNGKIEFSCGMIIENDQFLITFGFQDNASYLLGVSVKTIEDFIFNECTS